jgi:hypothetical protein
MHPAWLIEGGVYGEELSPLLTEIRRQGMVVDVVPHKALRKGAVITLNGEPLQPQACVIGYGTFPFVRQIQLHHRWVPGAWCSEANLDCATYAAYFGKFLLNQHYTLLPGVEAIRQQDWLYSIMGHDGELFVRPASCGKLFVGKCVKQQTFSSVLGPSRFDPSTLVVIAPPREIRREWRLVVIDGRIISGCQYADRGQRDIVVGLPAEVQSFAETMLQEVRWCPDPIFMLDICESAGHLWLVELNSFSSSWLYQCDLSAVVAEASRLASQIWERSSQSD